MIVFQAEILQLPGRADFHRHGCGEISRGSVRLLQQIDSRRNSLQHLRLFPALPHCGRPLLLSILCPRRPGDRLLRGLFIPKSPARFIHFPGRIQSQLRAGHRVKTVAPFSADPVFRLSQNPGQILHLRPPVLRPVNFPDQDPGGGVFHGNGLILQALLHRHRLRQPFGPACRRSFLLQNITPRHDPLQHIRLAGAYGLCKGIICLLVPGPPGIFHEKTLPLAPVQTPPRLIQLLR